MSAECLALDGEGLTLRRDRGVKEAWRHEQSGTAKAVVAPVVKNAGVEFKSPLVTYLRFNWYARNCLSTKPKRICDNILQGALAMRV